MKTTLKRFGCVLLAVLMTIGLVSVALAADEDGGDDYSVSPLALKTESNVSAKNKEDMPSVDKQVEEKNDSTPADPTWGEHADYDIGDSIEYRITGTLHGAYDYYYAYYYSFVDIMSEGLTYNDDAKVYVVNGDEKIEITSYFRILWDEDSGKLTITCDNLKEIEKVVLTSEIVVEYSAKLNKNAKIGSKGNPNTVYLEYTNDRSYDGEGNPGSTEQTKEDTNIVFTFDGVVNKTDSDGKALKGAAFTLYKWIYDANNENGGYWDEVKAIPAGDDTTFTFHGLDVGKYKIVETKAPDGYNTASDIEFVIVPEYNTDVDPVKLIGLVVKDSKGNVISSGKDPAFTADHTSGKVTTVVENLTGSELPETGGMGITVFYVAGALMVLGAGALLITKRRMREHG